MRLQTDPPVEIPERLIEAIRRFPRGREVEHCGHRFRVSPFDLYAVCPVCGSRIKLRAFSAGHEIEDVFDAVFEWMNHPDTAEWVRRRREVLGADQEDGDAD
jgi:hypothetical protein